MRSSILLFVLLLIVSCSYYGDYTPVHYYKYNEIPKAGSYYIVYERGLDNYSNAQYLAVSRKIVENLENLNMVKANSLESADYILYYTFTVSQKNQEYQSILSVKMFDRKEKISAYNNTYTKILQSEKPIFDSQAIMFSESYEINQSINCLIPAIFKLQVINKNKSLDITKKVGGENFDISTGEGVYYCL
jgi:hypothetical protein